MATPHNLKKLGTVQNDNGKYKNVSENVGKREKIRSKFRTSWDNHLLKSSGKWDKIA